MEGTRIVILSDVHIGIDAPTNWYQSEIHARYVEAVFDDIISRANSIREFILLGDLFDRWTYLPSVRPPTFTQIISDPVNLSVFNKLRAVVDALDGRVSFVPGNHDMTITQADLYLLRGQKTGKAPQLQSEIYLPQLDGIARGSLVCTHGHRYSMLCASDYEVKNNLSPRGLGWYVTRAGAYLANKQLTHDKPNVAYLPDQGAPTSLDLTYKDYLEITGSLSWYSLGGAIIDAVQKKSGLGWQEPILEGNGQVTLNEAFYNFSGLLDTWENKHYLNGESYGRSGALFAFLYPDIYNDLSWYAQRAAGAYGATAVVMGHTHVPKYEKLARVYAHESGKFIYANSGFNCPSIPDMKTLGKHPTYVEIDISLSVMRVYLKSVIPQKDELVVVEEPVAELPYNEATQRVDKVASE